MHDLFEVLREEKPYLLKDQIISLFNISKMRIDDEDNEIEVDKKKPKSISIDKN